MRVNRNRYHRQPHHDPGQRRFAIDHRSGWGYKNGRFVRLSYGGLMSITNGYCTLTEFKAHMYDANNSTVTTDDTAIEKVIEAVSRFFDNYCHRRFWKNSTAEARYFTAQSTRTVYVDDLVSVTSLETDDGTRTYGTTWTASDYDMLPDNAALNDQPYTWIEISPSGNYYFPEDLRRGVKLTGVYGWNAVPGQIREACIIQSMRIWKRKDAPFGVVGSAEMGQAVVIAKLDPDVEMMIAPFKRVL